MEKFGLAKVATAESNGQTKTMLMGTLDTMEANPPHGEKGNFVKVTITLPPGVYEMIAAEATRRKMAKERNPLVSAIIREAVVSYLQTKR